MKRILVLWGSPHPKGYTHRLLEEFLRPFQEAGHCIQWFDTYKEAPSPCRACGWCAAHEGCIIEDSCGELDESLRECDLLVVASPVYNLSFPAPLKAVLDRFQRYFEARFSLGKKPPIAKHRPAVLLVTAGAPSSEGPAIMEKQLRQCFSVMNTILRETVVWPATDSGEKAWPEVKSAVNRLSLAISGEI